MEMKVVKEEESKKVAMRRGSGWWGAGWEG